MRTRRSALAQCASIGTYTVYLKKTRYNVNTDIPIDIDKYITLNTHEELEKYNKNNNFPFCIPVDDELDFIMNISHLYLPYIHLDQTK